MPSETFPLQPAPTVCICGRGLVWRTGATPGKAAEPRWACPEFDFDNGLRSNHIDMTVGMLKVRPGGEAIISRRP